MRSLSPSYVFSLSLSLSLSLLLASMAVSLALARLSGRLSRSGSSLHHHLHYSGTIQVHGYYDFANIMISLQPVPLATGVAISLIHFNSAFVVLDSPSTPRHPSNKGFRWFRKEETIRRTFVLRVFWH